MALMTGDAGTALNEHIEAAGVPVLRKPFTMETLGAFLKTRAPREMSPKP